MGKFKSPLYNLPVNNYLRPFMIKFYFKSAQLKNVYRLSFSICQGSVPGTSLDAENVTLNQLKDKHPFSFLKSLLTVWQMCYGTQFLCPSPGLTIALFQIGGICSLFPGKGKSSATGLLDFASALGVVQNEELIC